MTQESAPAPDQPRSRRLTPVVGVIALVAALAGGAIAAIVTASVDKGSRAAAATVTVHDVTTVQAPNTLASTQRVLVLCRLDSRVDDDEHVDAVPRADARGDLQGRRPRRRLGHHDARARARGTGIGDRARHRRLHPDQRARDPGPEGRARLVLEQRQRARAGHRLRRLDRPRRPQGRPPRERPAPAAAR